MFSDIHKPLSVSQFNRIKTIEEQRHDIDSGILQAIAELFIYHGQDRDFGICLAHRHGTLLEGYVMVHSYPAEDVDKCEMQPLGTRTLFPCSFFLDETHRIVPFEYSSIPQVEPTSSFLADLVRFLVQYGLHDTLGLCCAKPLEQPWTEHVAEDGKSTVAIQSKEVNENFCQNGVVTQWGFLADGATVRVMPLRKCVEPEGGGHKTTRVQSKEGQSQGLQLAEFS